MKPYGAEGANYYENCKCDRCRGEGRENGRSREKRAVDRDIVEYLNEDQ